MYRIYKMLDGTYQAICMTQGGSERETYPSLEEAISGLILSAKAYNHSKITRKGITYHEEYAEMTSQYIQKKMPKC